MSVWRNSVYTTINKVPCNDLVQMNWDTVHIDLVFPMSTLTSLLIRVWSMKWGARGGGGRLYLDTSQTHSPSFPSFFHTSLLKVQLMRHYCSPLSMYRFRREVHLRRQPSVELDIGLSKPSHRSPKLTRILSETSCLRKKKYELVNDLFWYTLLTNSHGDLQMIHV